MQINKKVEEGYTLNGLKSGAPVGVYSIRGMDESYVIVLEDRRLLYLGIHPDWGTLETLKEEMWNGRFFDPVGKVLSISLM